jgi:hypothetical protein
MINWHSISTLVMAFILSIVLLGSLLEYGKLFRSCMIPTDQKTEIFLFHHIEFEISVLTSFYTRSELVNCSCKNLFD